MGVRQLPRPCGTTKHPRVSPGVRHMPPHGLHSAVGPIAAPYHAPTVPRRASLRWCGPPPPKRPPPTPPSSVHGSVIARAFVRACGKPCRRRRNHRRRFHQMVQPRPRGRSGAGVGGCAHRASVVIRRWCRVRRRVRTLEHGHTVHPSAVSSLRPAPADRRRHALSHVAQWLLPAAHAAQAHPPPCISPPSTWSAAFLAAC